MKLLSDALCITMLHTSALIHQHISLKTTATGQRKYSSEECAALQGLDWEFAIINEPTVNAFVVPGGKVVFYTGLLRLLESEDEIAAILGHEAAHVVARHIVSAPHTNASRVCIEYDTSALHAR